MVECFQIVQGTAIQEANLRHLRRQVLRVREALSNWAGPLNEKIRSSSTGSEPEHWPTERPRGRQEEMTWNPTENHNAKIIQQQWKVKAAYHLFNSLPTSCIGPHLLFHIHTVLWMVKPELSGFCVWTSHWAFCKRPYETACGSLVQYGPIFSIRYDLIMALLWSTIGWSWPHYGLALE